MIEEVQLEVCHQVLCLHVIKALSAREFSALFSLSSLKLHLIMTSSRQNAIKIAVTSPKPGLLTVRNTNFSV